MSANGALPLGDVRDALKTALAPAADSDPDVHIDYPDMVTPPCLVVAWDDPWIERPATMGPALVTANLSVLCVGARIEAGSGIDAVEDLVVFTINRLLADSHRWPLGTAQNPREWVISGIHYLASRLAYRVPVTVE